jgi:hypothetical protein
VEMIDSMRSHRYRGARTDKTFAPFAIEGREHERCPVVRSESAWLELVGRVVRTYLFIKFAACSLETRRSISLVVISYRRDHLQLSSSMQSPFMPC